MTQERLDPASDRTKLALDHLVRYRFASQLAPGKRILDVACGFGFGTAMLADAGADYVTGVDLAAEAIDHARAQYHRANGRFMTGDALRLADLGLAPVDLITCFETLEHLDKPERVVAELKTQLAPGGQLLISIPNDIATGAENEFHRIRLSLAQFQSLLEREFRHVAVFHQFYYAASIITPDRPPWSQGELSWEMRNPAGADASPYYVAHCSQDELPPLKPFGFGSSQLWLDMERYIRELDDGRRWLEGQLQNWRAEADRLAQDLTLQKAWTEELERAKQWLDEQRGHWQAQAERYKQQLIDLGTGSEHAQQGDPAPGGE